MKLQILNIQNHGDYDEEYIDLEVLEPCDLKYYQVADTTYTGDNKISNRLRHYYWFTSKPAKTGDFVRLFTKSGTNTSWANGSKTTTHVYFWGLERAVWNNDGDCAILLELTAWAVKPVR